MEDDMVEVSMPEGATPSASAKIIELYRPENKDAQELFGVLALDENITQAVVVAFYRDAGVQVFTTNLSLNDYAFASKMIEEDFREVLNSEDDE